MINARTLGASLVTVAITGGVATRAAQAAPAIDVFPNPIGFGGGGMLYNGGMPGEHQWGYYQITNPGTTTLTVAAMTITAPGAGVVTYDDETCGQGTSCPLTFTVAPGAYREFVLACVTTAPGTFPATLTITSDATSGTGTIPISCLGLNPPQLQITPAGLDFGSAHSCWYGDACGPSCNTQPLLQTLTISNVAPAPSEIDVSMVLPQSGSHEDFTIDGAYGWPTMLAGGESIPLTFAFHPRGGRQQYYDAPLTITTSYPAGLAPVDIPFHAHGGWGHLVVDSPPLLGIGPIGQPIVTTITAHNAGDSCLDLVEAWFENTITLIGPPPPALLQAGESITWTVSCTPTTALGDYDWFHLGFVYDEPESGMMLPFYCQGAGGSLQTDPTQAAFTGTAEVGVGMSATQRLRVYNAGNQSTDLTAMISSDPHFTVALASGHLPVTLAPGAETQVDVTFTPTDTARVFGSILLDGSSGDDGNIDTVGDGVILAASATPASYDFGAVVVPATPSHDFQLQNTGERTLTVDAVSLDLPNDFAITGLAAGATIDPGATLAFSVRATPTSLGQRPATLAIDLDRALDLTIPLVALASDPALAVTTGDPSPDDDLLQFGRVDVDVGPRTAPVSLHDTAAGAMAITSCAITGDPGFTVAACPTTIAPGATADVVIAFAPTVEGNALGTLTVTGTGFATGSLRIGLHGLGFDQHVALSATSVAFAHTFRHPTAPATQVVTIRNTATIELALTAITVSGDGFTRVSPATATLAPGASTDVTIAFAPTVIGAFTGELVVGNDDDPQIARVALTGDGIARDLEISPTVIDLGTVTVGTTVRLGDLAPDAIAIHNVDAAATFTISQVTLAGDPAYTLIGPDVTTLAPGDRARLDLALAPTTAGVHAATIDVHVDGDPAPTAHLTVTAIAVDATPPTPPTDGGGGCGCRTDDPANALPLALVVALVALRRRPVWI